MVWNNPADLTFSGVGFSDTQTGSWLNFIQPGEKDGAGNHTEAWAWKGSNSVELMQEAVFIASENTIVSTSAGQAAPKTSPPHSRKSVTIDVGKFLSSKILGDQIYRHIH